MEEVRPGEQDFEEGSESPDPGDGRDKERKGSTCKQLRPLPTFLKVDSQSSVELAERTYVRKTAADLTMEEQEYNEKVCEETLAIIFPEDKMKDKFYRDKEKEAAVRAWILTIIEDDEADSSRRRTSKSSNKPEVEDLNFLLKSGIVLCRLINKIYPQSQIDVGSLQAGNLNTKKKNISQFLVSARAYGLEERYLFKPDDLVVMAHFHKVTRALFALAERTKMDPTFTGESLTYTEITSQSNTRKVSGSEDRVQAGSLNAIFENLMQDVERKTSIVSKGPPRNIYSSCN